MLRFPEWDKHAALGLCGGIVGASTGSVPKGLLAYAASVGLGMGVTAAEEWIKRRMADHPGPGRLRELIRPSPGSPLGIAARKFGSAHAGSLLLLGLQLLGAAALVAFGFSSFSFDAVFPWTLLSAAGMLFIAFGTVLDILATPAGGGERSKL